jgi:arylsulfatase A-like enzyme
MTNFESGVRNAMLWRIPGQRLASQGLNTRIVESIDIFPTILELTGTPSLPKCHGIDQPPTTLCLQGESYASEFIVGSTPPSPPKQYAFSQWPYPKWGNETGLRQGYTVRSATGYRYTQCEYCSYSQKSD